MLPTLTGGIAYHGRIFHMTVMQLNRFAQELKEMCAGRVLYEKWLVAPSLRVGTQWLDAVTASGQPVLNVRLKTLTSLALGLAAPEMERRGCAFAHGVRIELLLDGIISRLRSVKGYFSRLESGPRLVSAVAATLRDLRLAGIGADRLQPDLFEVASKGHDLAALLSEYHKELEERRLVDYADVLRLAAERLAGDASYLPEGCLVILPEDMYRDLRALERALWEALPEANRAVLAVDRAGKPRDGDNCDAALLAWINRPGDAPAPRGDGTADIFRAVGEVNEVRGVLRRCVERGIPLDQVEILHTQAGTYLPLVYELASRHAAEPGGPVPVTFAEGIPVGYSRPGRALKLWISWIREGYPRSILSCMIRDGLLQVEEKGDQGPVFSRLATELESLPIGAGREGYLAVIDAAIAVLEKQAGVSAKAMEENDHGVAGLTGRQSLPVLRALRSLLQDLLRHAPQPGNNWKLSLEGVDYFLRRRVRCLNELDAYALRRLLEETAKLSECLQNEDPSCLDLLDWLARLIGTAAVEGKGPRPGCLYVAPLWEGGHSGRPHTFIIGLDDGRFPFAGDQDPLLLDYERERISEHLPTASKHLAASMERIAEVIARTRGCITLSYCCRSLEDDRDMFPSPALVAAYRILSGNHDGLQEDFLEWLPPPVSFAPVKEEECVDDDEWWLHKLCGKRAFEDPEKRVGSAFPHLGMGLVARQARESPAFTIYDGYVPQAGEDLDPGGPQGPVLSASRLEKLGRCPLEYFFRYLLDIEPPKVYLPDSSTWLDQSEKGNLLHAVFRRFMRRLQKEGRLPKLKRDLETLHEILQAEISAWAKIKPPPNREAFEADVGEMSRTAHIFLQEEERICRFRRPLYFEAAIGLEAEGEGNPIDSPDPAVLALPGGRTVRARGYIDRVDELLEEGKGSIVVCDYKTGSSRSYDRRDPFRKGRRLQSAFYLALAEASLEKRHPGAGIAYFEYFFPNASEHGERLRWSREQLEPGRSVIAHLCEMLARGCFPFTDQAEDVRYSEYLPAFGDVAKAAKAMQVKLSNPVNAVLAPFRLLRGYEETGNDK